MIKILVLTGVLSFFGSISYCQTCNCEKNFEWVKKTFEENDAGFKYALDNKGKTAYTNHTTAIRQKIKSVKNLPGCTKLLYEWLTFFRAGHIAISMLPNKADAPTPPNKKLATANWETIKVDVPAFEKYLAAKKETDFEGIWETPPL